MQKILKGGNEKFHITFLCLVFSAYASAKSLNEQLGCNTVDENEISSDPCFHLKDKEISIIFNPSNFEEEMSQPLISINGKITKLKLIHSSDYLSKAPRDMYASEIKGDSHFYNYAAKNIKVEYQTRLVGDGCNYLNEKGVYESEEKCCYQTYKSKIKVVIGDKIHTFNVTNQDGAG